MRRARRMLVRLAAVALVASGVAGAALTPAGAERASQPEEPAAGRIDTGFRNSCVVDQAGAAWCAGGSGLLGSPQPGPSSSFARVRLPAGRTARQVVVGNLQGCVLLDDGSVACWGSNLGVGLDEEIPVPVLAHLPAGRTATAITAGDSFGCALLDDGTAVCWGTGLNGRLGTGSTGDALSPTPVVLPAGRTLTALSAGGAHACGLLDDGSAVCWGANSQGQLGDGTTTSTTTGVAVALPSGRQATAISAGAAHSCAALDDGTAVCWGGNPFGALGDGTTTDSSVPVPVSLPAGRDAVAISAGTGLTCAVLDDGAAWCWGLNERGQVGDGTTTNALVPVPVATPPGRTAVAVSAGNGFPGFSCALLDDDSVSCWGDNSQGQLGNGTTTSSSTPVPASYAPDPEPDPDPDPADLRLSSEPFQLPLTIADGEQRTLQLIVRNTGPGVANGVAVRIALPSGVTIVRAAAANGSLTGDLWTLPYPILPGGSNSLYLTLSRTGPDATARFEVAAAGQPDPDSTPGNAATTDPAEDDELEVVVRPAAHRYATPLGAETGECLTAATACTITRAARGPSQSGVALPGDVIHVGPGTYDLGTQGLTLPPGAALLGAPSARPILTRSDNVTGTLLFLPNQGEQVADVELLDTTTSQSNSALSTNTAAGGATIERVVIRSTNRRALGPGPNVTVRDSILVGHHPTLGAVRTTQTGVVLDNVTVIGGDGGAVEGRVTITNTIARSSGTDLRSGVTASRSSFATADAGSTVPGSGDNQTAAPLFVDAANGDYHQAPGSPTIDAGAGTPAPERRDVDGQPRAFHGVDIGGDEVYPLTSVWSGGGTDDLWSNAANWVDGAVPIDGSEIVLPAGPADRATVADFDIAPASISVGANYSIGGAGVVDLTGGAGHDTLRIAASATLVLTADVVFADWVSGPDPSGTLVLAGSRTRAQSVMVDGSNSNSSAPHVVVSGIYPNTVLHECERSCDVRPGGTIGALIAFRTARVSGTVLGDVTQGTSSNGLEVGPPDAASGTSAKVGGSLELSNSDSLALDVFPDGTADRLDVTGAVSLSTLAQTFLYVSGPDAFTGPAPSRIVLIDNAGSDPITGGFFSSPEGTEVELAGATYRLTYVGGDGNDLELVLTDTTDPTIAGSVSPSTPTGTNGWYWGPTGPTVSFACSDAGSGIATCTGPTTLGSSATAQSVTGTATDRAGNTASTTVSGVKVDLVAPTVACPTVTPSFAVGQAGTVTAAVSDAHSGPTSATVKTTVPTGTAGSSTASLTGTDQAGNSTTVSCPYVVQKIATVLHAHPVLLRLTGGISFDYPLTATLKDAAGKPLADQVVRFAVGGRQVCSATSNARGEASCGRGVGWSIALLGGGYTASYAGSATYQPSSATAGLLG